MKQLIFITFALLLALILGCKKNSDEIQVQKSTSEVTDVKKTEEEIPENENKNPTKVYSSYEAASHEGEFASVKGFVADVYFSEKAVFMNFEKKYPSNIFTAVVFKRDLNKFQDLNQYKNKYVKVEGVIKLYKGKPEIILKSPQQIKVENK
jgi:DNA/RNA endonuclease YhcR with UshA esterase domain